MPNYSDWQVPDRSASDDRKLGWLNECCQEGQLFHKYQRNSFDEAQKAFEIISGCYDEIERPVYRSRLTGNRLRTNIRTAIAGLSAIKPFWGYHSENKAYLPFAEELNKLNRALYLANQWGQDVKKALQWAAATRMGFMRPCYRRADAGWGKGNLYLDTYGAPSVLPVQLPANGNWQGAYAVTLMDEKPIWEAHGMFPDFQDQLKPTSSRYWYQSEIRTAAKGNTRYGWRWWKKGREADQSSDLFIPLRYTTVNDLAINNSGKTIAMGEPGSPWYYEVPPFDPDGKLSGKVHTVNDARLYPYRRLLISSENCLLYDGPSFNWHGELDLIPFCLDSWPWEPLGFSMVHDGYAMQKGIDEIDRGTMDRIRAQADLPLAYNMDAVSKREADQFDPMQPRSRIAYDGGATDKPFTTPVPPEVYNISPAVLEFKKELEAAMDYTLQTRDIVELGKARALGKGMDQLEALISAQGPIVKDMASGMEASLCCVGRQLMYLEMEYLPTAKVMQYVGDDEQLHTYDYDPASLVPSHMPGENPFDTQQQPVKSSYPAMVRARHLAENVGFYLLPGSIHELTQMTQRLLLLQLRQRGFPISAATIMQACNIPDIQVPDGATEQERFYNEKKEELVTMAQIAQVAQALGIGPEAMGGGGGKNKGGRPASGQQPPQLQKKGDGRPVVSESG